MRFSARPQGWEENMYTNNYDTRQNMINTNSVTKQYQGSGEDEKLHLVGRIRKASRGR